MKYALFDMTGEQLIFEGAISRIGLDGSEHSFSYAGGEKTVQPVPIHDHAAGLDVIASTLADGPVGSLDEIDAVAHRTGNGGKYLAAVVTPDVMSELERMIPIMPLHQPAMIREIRACLIAMPNAVHVSIPDCWFHDTIPEEARVYGLPYEFYADYGYKRIGYHGSSHPSACEQAARYLGVPLTKLKIISCHLGNGASLCAVKYGKSIDNTLGLSPLEGLIMGTRCGDVDPGLIPVIMKEKSLSPDDMIDMLYNKSGLLGISGKSPDMREIRAAMAQGDERCALAFNGFCYRVKRHAGGMLMALGGCDALIFTGGIGENNPDVRSNVLKGAEGLGFAIDEELNQTRNSPPESDPVADISAPSSKVKILVVNTFEEIILARKCREVVEAQSGR